MSTPTLIETIKIQEGEVLNLSYHQARCDKSRKALLNIEAPLTLSKSIKAPPKGIWRCRILYHETIKSIEYIPYHPKEITCLKVVSSSLNYAHKYADRSALDSLLQKKDACEDVLIEKDGYVTDTTIANIAFYDGAVWYTPSKPLLEGTMRAKLLDEGLIQTKMIRTGDLENYTQVALMNAMLGFKVLKDVQIEDQEGKIHDY